MKKVWAVCLSLIFLGACFCLTGGTESDSTDGGGAAQADEMTWLGEEEQALDGEFDPAQSAVLNTGEQRASMFSWSMSLICDGVFFDLSQMLTDLEIDRIYQAIPEPYFSQMETAVMVDNLARIGVETVFLIGEREWGCGSLDDYYHQIDALCAYNEGIGASHPIHTVALDVESYTFDEWSAQPEEYFALYVEKMGDAYQYAHEQGLTVVQVIPTHLDTVSRELFEKFVRDCCDELSIMNYQKDRELSSIWNEVLVCRELGKPVETIFETMPLDDYYDVTEEITYFYDGMDALNTAKESLLNLYGDSLGISYHHFQTMYHVYTGAYMAEIYPYASQGNRQKDQYGQPKVLESILLRGSDGSLQVAYPCRLDLEGASSEACYLAVGVKPGITYTVTMQSQVYGVDADDAKLKFTFEDGKVVDATSLSVHRLD